MPLDRIAQNDYVLAQQTKEVTRAMDEMTATHVRRQFGKVLNRVVFQGETITITTHGVPSARIVPISDGQEVPMTPDEPPEVE